MSALPRLRQPEAGPEPESEPNPTIRISEEEGLTLRRNFESMIVPKGTSAALPEVEVDLSEFDKVFEGVTPRERPAFTPAVAPSLTESVAGTEEVTLQTEPRGNALAIWVITVMIAFAAGALTFVAVQAALGPDAAESGAR